jgi:hypothetical protein
MEICSFCDRETPDQYIEKHHLVPRCKKGKISVVCCVDCGNQIHQLFTIKDLGQQHNTLENLKNHPKDWVDLSQEERIEELSRIIDMRKHPRPMPRNAPDSLVQQQTNK